jgi:hypothetical protein
LPVVEYPNDAVAHRTQGVVDEIDDRRRGLPSRSQLQHRGSGLEGLPQLDLANLGHVEASY